MQIVYLLSQFPTANHTYLLREIIGLRNLGWDVKVISVRGPDRPSEALSDEERAATESTFYVIRAGYVRLLSDGVIACLLNPRSAFRGVLAALNHSRSASDFFSFLVYVLEGAIVCREIGDEGTHLHGHFCMQLLVLLHAMRGSNWSATIHGPAEFDGARSHLLPAVVGHSRFVRTISSYGRAQCLYRSPGSNPDKVFVNRLGVTETWLSSIGGEPLPRSSSSRAVITVGRLSYEKGQRFLLEAFSQVASRFGDSTLTVIGDGPGRADLEKQAEDLGIAASVQFAGWRSPGEVLKALMTADVFVSTSFAEGIPVVLMEAMAVGVACIATPVGGVSDLVEHGVSGLLTQPADVPAVVQALDSLLSNAPLRRKLADAAKARVSAEFSLSTNIAALSEQFVSRLSSS